jgi:hypothetical protein
LALIAAGYVLAGKTIFFMETIARTALAAQNQSLSQMN